MEEQPPSPKKKRKCSPKPKDQQEFVVKASLNGSLKSNPEEKERLVRLLKGWSDSLSQRLNFASRALTLILKESFNKYDFKTAPIPQFLEQTFIRQLMLGLERTRGEQNSYLQTLFEKYPQLLRDTPRYQGDRNLYSSAATSYLTNLKVSLSYIFEKRLLKLAFSQQRVQDWKENETIKIFKHKILGDFLPKDIEEMKLETKYPSLVAFIKEVRDFLDLQQGETITNYWLKTNPYKVVRFYAYILSKLTKDDKSFNLLPLTSIRNHFATLDKSCLLGLFKEAGLLKRNVKKGHLTNDYLESIFKLPKKANDGKNVFFTGTIQTDGTSICLHYRRPKLILTQEERDKINQETKEMFLNDDVDKYGGDPGREELLRIVKEGEPNKSWRLTRKGYYAVSGIYKARKKVKSWTKPIQSSLDALSKVTSKGIGLEPYLRYLKVFFINYDKLWNEYSKKKWAAQRLRLHGGKKRCFANFFNSVFGKEHERTKQIVFAYGAAKFAPGGKGEMSVPTARIFKELQNQRMVRTHLTDEFRSSRIKYGSHEVLHKVKIEDADKPLRGLLWCCSTSSKKQGYFVNRDVNAAWNIIKLAKERPQIFQRSNDLRRLPKQEVGKIIKKIIQPAKNSNPWEMVGIVSLSS
jgi:hypothetical protein